MLISGSGQTSLSLPCFHLQSSLVVLNTDGLPRYNAFEMTFCALESLKEAEILVKFNGNMNMQKKD